MIGTCYLASFPLAVLDHLQYDANMVDTRGRAVPNEETQNLFL